MKTFTIATLLAVLASPAMSIDVGIVGHKLVVLDRLEVGKAKIVFVSKDPALTKGAGTDPAQIDAQFDLLVGSVTGSFVAPAGSQWIANEPILAKFANPSAPGGGLSVKTTKVRSGIVAKLVAKGLGEALPSIIAGQMLSGPTYAALTLRNGAEEFRFCTQFPTCIDKPLASGGRKLTCKVSATDPACTAARPVCGLPLATDLGSTVVDTCTGLEWEQKDAADGIADPGNLHDVDNRYDWWGFCTGGVIGCQPDAAAVATCMAATGSCACSECGPGEGTCFLEGITTVWDWLNQVNAETFAGHADWRLPTGFPSGVPELESLIDLGQCGGTGACIDPTYGAAGLDYWSSSTSASNGCGLPALTHATPPLLRFRDLGTAHVRAVRSP